LVLYTSAWGSQTLTDFKNRREVAFDQNHTPLQIYTHGNTPIPTNGFVLSFPSSYTRHQALVVNSLIISAPGLGDIETLSAVMGIPELLSNATLCDDLAKHTSNFYTRPHARTALGIKKNGDIVIVVAEHAYKKNLKELTLDDIKTALTDSAIEVALHYRKLPKSLTLDELKAFIEEKFSVKNGTIGLTIPELAKIMLDRGCDSAINLDGGGSSTLWMAGKTVNQAIDENGQIMTRAVSDAIIFKKRPTNA